MTEPTEPGAPRQIVAPLAPPAWLVAERPPCGHMDADGPCRSLITTRASRAAGAPRCWAHSPDVKRPRPRCSEVNQRGQACGALPTVTSNYARCRHHTPERLARTAEQRAATTRRRAEVAQARIEAARAPCSPILADATARLDRYVTRRCVARTAYQHRHKWGRFVAFQATCPDQPLVDQMQAWLASLPASSQQPARVALKLALGAAACDWSALVLKRYARNEIQLAQSVLKEGHRARVREAARSPEELAIVESLWTLRAEVAALCWRDLDLTGGLVYVRRGKGDKAAWTLLPTSTRAALTAWYEAAGSPPADRPVFPVPAWHAKSRVVADGHYTPHGLGKLVRRILLRAGLWAPGSGTTHRFRRSFATTYIRTNPGDLAGLQKLMRHTLLSTTGKYLYLEPEDLAPRMAAMQL